MSQQNPKIALFPGTFDPITNGHLDVIRRGVTLFDRLIVAIGTNPGKSALFTPAERMQIIREIIDAEGWDVEVDIYQGLTVDYAKKINATVILRGLRNVSDLASEFQLALTNRAITGIETLFLMSGEAYGFTSSSLIKQIAAAGALDRLDPLLPDQVISRLKDRESDLKQMFNDSLK